MKKIFSFLRKHIFFLSIEIWFSFGSVLCRFLREKGLCVCLGLCDISQANIIKHSGLVVGPTCDCSWGCHSVNSSSLISISIRIGCSLLRDRVKGDARDQKLTGPLVKMCAVRHLTITCSVKILHGFLVWGNPKYK